MDTAGTKIGKDPCLAGDTDVKENHLRDERVIITAVECGSKERAGPPWQWAVGWAEQLGREGSTEVPSRTGPELRHLGAREGP